MSRAGLRVTEAVIDARAAARHTVSAPRGSRASLGGVLVGVALHFVPGASSRMSAIAVLPLRMLAGEGHAPPPERNVELRRHVIVDASPATIWSQI